MSNFYHEAIESRLELLKEFKAESIVRKLVRRGIARDRFLPEHRNQILSEPLFMDEMADSLAFNLARSDCYYWDPQITQLATSAGLQIDEQTQFHRSWLQSFAAYWWFGLEPLASLSGTEFNSLVYWWEDSSVMRETGSAGGVMIYGFYLNGNSNEPKVNDQFIISWAEGESMAAVLARIDNYDPSSDPEVPANLDYPKGPELELHKQQEKKLVRLFAAGTLWLQQTITVAEPAVLDRAARRRLERLNIPPVCLVVHLRRKEYGPSGEHHAVDWAWQWAVRGHWRKLEGGERLVYVHPYIKGPEGRPLKPTAARVFSVDR